MPAVIFICWLNALAIWYQASTQGWPIFSQQAVYFSMLFSAAFTFLYMKVKKDQK